MEIARITTKGQITIPLEIRRRLDLKKGDKIIFLEQDGRIYFKNAALMAFNGIQDAIPGKAQRNLDKLLALNTKDDPVLADLWNNKKDAAYDRL